MTKITNFQTSFCITSSDKNRVFDGVKAIILQWVKGKEKDQRIVENQGRFNFRVRPIKNLYATGASVETDTFKSDDEERWAMRYRHPDREAERYWYVDVGLTKNKEHVIFLITVAYAWRETYLGDQSEAPSPNIPWVVKGILQQASQEGWHCYSGDPSAKVSATKIDIDQPGKGKAVWDLIESPGRRIPAIIVNGSHLVEIAQGFAERLQGKAIIIHLHDNYDLADELKHYIPKDMDIRHGQVRVFFTVNQQRRRPQVHRYFYPENESFAQDREIIIRTILRNYALQEPNATTDVIDIDSRINRQLLINKLLQATAAKGIDDGEVSALLNNVAQDYQKKLDEKTQHLEMFEEENRNLEQEIHTHRSKIAYLQQAASGSSREGTPVIIRGKESDMWPNEVQGIARSCLLKAKVHFPETGRVADVIDDLLHSNQAESSSLISINEALNDVFKNGYQSLSKKDRQRLESCGLTILDEGKHYKMRFENEERYSVTFAKTASDHRAGMNIIRDIKATFGISQVD